MHRRIFLICSLLTLWHAAIAQHYYGVPQRLGMHPHGLSNNTVQDIAQDRFGNIWVATDFGLNRFDGTLFHPFYHQEGNQQSISSNSINCLYDDPQSKTLWIGLRATGISLYDYVNHQFTHYIHDHNDGNSLIADCVTEISPASDGGLWVATWNGGIDYFDKRHNRFVHYNQATVPMMSSNQAWSVSDDGKGNIYVGHVKQGMSVINIRTHSCQVYHQNAHPDSLLTVGISKVLCDSRGRVWIGTKQGLQRFDPEKRRFVDCRGLHHALKGEIRDIVELHRSGDVCVTTAFSQVVIIHANGTTTSQSCLPSAFPNDAEAWQTRLNCIMEDEGHNLWVGAEKGGVYFVSGFRPLFSHFSLSADNAFGFSGAVTSLAMPADGRRQSLLAGTDGAGVVEPFSPSGIRNRCMQGKHIVSLHTDRESALWIGAMPGGLFRQVAGGGEAQLVYNCDEPRYISRESSGQLWLAAGNVKRVSPKDNDVTDLAKKSLSGRFVWSVLHTHVHHDYLWAGTYGSGLIVYNMKGDIVRDIFVDKQKHNFPGNDVYDIIETRKGDVWIATNGGPVCFPQGDPNHFFVPLAEQSPALSIIEDHEGNIWYTTLTSICCLPQTRGRTSQPMNFTGNGNIPHVNFCYASKAIDKEGNIYFGTTEGICSFAPHYVLNHFEKPRPRITAAYLLTPSDSVQDSQHLWLPEGGDTKMTCVTTDARHNTFKITFSTYNYAHIADAQFSYRLKGLSNQWYTSESGRHEAIYYNVPPGHYEFQLRARFSGQEWSDVAMDDDITTVLIDIEPLWWQTTLAYVLYTVFGILLVVVLLWLWKRKIGLENEVDNEKRSLQREQQASQERSRLFTNIAHELRTPLTLIIAPLDELSKDRAISSKQRHRLELILQSAQHMQGLVGNLMELRRIESGYRSLKGKRTNLSTLLSEIVEKFTLLETSNSNVKISTHIQPDFWMYCDADAITLVVDNLLSNAIKYTPEGHIHLTLSGQRATDNGQQTTDHGQQTTVSSTDSGQRQAVISVCDTGVGINETDRNVVFDRYWQAESADKSAGSGIGLSLVKNLCKLHGGDVKLHSRTAGTGSVFVVTLAELQPDSTAAEDEDQMPQANSQQPTTDIQQPAADSSALPADAPAEKKKILIVEDNKDIREYLSEVFAGEYTLLLATNGQTALSLAQEEMPDIIISDIIMPVMDGVSLCRKLKADYATSHIPIILLTAKDTIHDRELAYNLGADSYITKPFTASLIQSRVTNLLYQRHMLATLWSQKLSPSTTLSDAFNEKVHALAKTQSQLDNEFIARLRQLIEETVTEEDVDVNRLAMEMGMSRSSFYRKLRAITNMSVKDFQTKIRMNLAEKMMLQGNTSISEVGYSVGYNNMVSFRKAFKDEFGVLPSEYIKMINNSDTSSDR